MRIGMRVLRPTTVQWLKEELVAGTATRYALGRGICEREDWRNGQGRLCISSANKALPRMAQELGQELPPPRPGPASRGGGFGEVPATRVECALAELGEVALQRIADSAVRGVWHAMLRAHHPRGISVAPGWRVTYLMVSERQGVVGGISFVAAGWHCAARDVEIGWSARARAANLQLLVRNDRYLILPDVRVKNLASHGLGLAVRQLPADWERLSGSRPAVLETFVDASHAGTCYLAAGWRRAARMTQGRPPGAAEAVEPKSLWLKELQPDWQQRMQREPARRIGFGPQAEDAPPGQVEFGRSDFIDNRLRERMVRIAERWTERAGRSLAEMFPGEAEHKAAVRFLRNRHVRCDDIVQPHREATLERMQQHRAVLIVQDGTAIELGRSEGSVRTLQMHASVAFTRSGRPLGVVGLDAWERQERQSQPERDAGETARWLAGFELACELGRHCPRTRVLAVCDPGAGAFDLFALQAARREEAGLLVTASGGRQLQWRLREGRQKRSKDLRQLLEPLDPVVHDRRIEIAGRAGERPRPARAARTELRVCRAELESSAEPLPVLLVQARNRHPARDSDEPFEWTLVCSDGEADAATASEAVGHYEVRSRMEEFFRLLKCGARAEERVVVWGGFDSICKAVVLDAIAACKVFSLPDLTQHPPAKAAS